MTEIAQEKIEWVEITEPTRKALKAERRRTGVGYAQLLKTTPNAPALLTADKVGCWARAQLKAPKAHLEFVLDAYLALPDLIMADPPAETLTKNSVEQIVRDEDQIKRHLTILRRIISLFSNNTKTLSDVLFEQSGERYSAHFIGSVATFPNRAALDAPSMALINALRSLSVYADAKAIIRPQLERPKRVMLNAEHLSLLESELERTGTTLGKLLTQLKPVIPKLRGDTMTRWRSGELKTAKADHWNAVIAALAARPNASTDKPGIRGARKLIIPDTAPSVKATIRSIDDTKVGPDLTLETLPQKRPWQPMLKRTATLKSGQYVEITRDIYNQLHSEVRRTLISPRRLFAISDDVPAGLRYPTISMWLYHSTKSAEPRYLHWTLRAYGRLRGAENFA